MISKKIQFLTLTILFIFATQNHIINADSTLLKNTEIAIDDGTQSKIIKKNFFFYEEGISHLKKSIFDVIQKHRGDVIVIPISLFELSDDAPEKKKESHSHSEKMPAKYDVEYLGNLEQYLKNHPHFVEEPTTEQNQLKLEKKMRKKILHQKEFFSNLDRILFLLRANKMEYKIVLEPIYKSQYQHFHQKEIQDFLNRLAQKTDFFDFLHTAVSNDPRYFYNPGNYREDVKSMILQRIQEEDSPLGRQFGHHIKRGSAYSILKIDEFSAEKSLKVLMLHHIADVNKDEANPAIISAKKLEELFIAIRDGGYQVIKLKDVENYVKYGVELPENPILLTFDDGYLSNYEVAYPLIKKYGYNAVFFPIGVSIGKDTYKDTGKKITPHYGLEHIREMVDSGYIEMGSHGYDIHQSATFEKEPVRVSIIKLSHETQKEYRDYIYNDFKNFNKIFEQLDLKISSMAYPLGRHDTMSDALVVKNGIKISFTTKKGESYLLKGLKQSMLHLNRFNIDMQTDLLKLLPSKSIGEKHEMD